MELRDVTIGPLRPGSSKQNLKLPAFPPVAALEHFRSGMPESVLKIERFQAGEADGAGVIEEPVLYGGLLFRHFGHALTESIHRLWPRFALPELSHAKVAFSLVKGAKLMPYIVEALNLNGIEAGSVVRITEATHFRRLFVGPQARQMAGPTLIPGYRYMLDPILKTRLPRPGKRKRRLYLSRMHHHHTGSYYGESFVESWLADEGFEIVYPEQHRLIDLVAILRDSSVAVFAEGSAIHALELCGSMTPAVFVIGRRRGSVERFSPLLSDICAKWEISDQWMFSVGMSEDRKKHSGVLDLLEISHRLSRFAGIRCASRYPKESIKQAIQADLERHIKDQRDDSVSNQEKRAQELRRLVHRAL